MHKCIFPPRLQKNPYFVEHIGQMYIYLENIYTKWGFHPNLLVSRVLLWKVVFHCVSWRKNVKLTFYFVESIIHSRYLHLLRHLTISDMIIWLFCLVKTINYIKREVSKYLFKILNIVWGYIVINLSTI